jgi:solute carrier family 10 (sodium/bile acid cotransporter), member 7
MRVFPKGAGLSVALVAVFIAAWIAPGGGLEGGPLFPERLSLVAVFVIFLIQGWKLDLGRLKRAWTDRRTLVFLHSFIFLAPLPMVLGVSEFGLVEPVWKPGLFFLAILPTTISSCVVYTRSADGDADAALGHATVSNLLGMLWVPLAWGFLVLPDATGGSNPFDSLRVVLPDFFVMILLPCLVGWWARNKLSWDLLPGDGTPMDKIPLGCILLLAYFSFCSLFDEFGSELFGESSGVLAGVVLVLLLAQTFLAWVVGRLVSDSRRARITFLFCGGQKSLALGLPLAQLLSGSDTASVGLLVLPLALFHFGQLLLGAFLIGPLNRWAKLR